MLLHLSGINSDGGWSTHIQFFPLSTERRCVETSSCNREFFLRDSQSTSSIDNDWYDYLWPREFNRSTPNGFSDMRCFLFTSWRQLHDIHLDGRPFSNASWGEQLSLLTPQLIGHLRRLHLDDKVLADLLLWNTMKRRHHTMNSESINLFQWKRLPRVLARFDYVANKLQSKHSQLSHWHY